MEVCVVIAKGPDTLSPFLFYFYIHIFTSLYRLAHSLHRKNMEKCVNISTELTKLEYDIYKDIIMKSSLSYQDIKIVVRLNIDKIVTEEF